ncbi:restriction endonuclease subunit S [Sphingobium xenophagum]|uniref:restriction endonuclease subunit S n=1 Tax=Sphingobium xenophagum TaxID=121428 RepID=UPI0024202F37|nr:restriction endonuclease subunit S [Sphingobium xenophagum]
MSDLPHGWAETTIGDVTEPFVSIDPTKEPNVEFRYLDIGSIDKSTQTIGEPKTFLGRDAPSRARRVIHEGDVLFSTVRTYLKNIAAVPEELDGALTSTGIAVLRASVAIDQRYLFNWVCSDEFVGKMSGAQDGTLYPAVTDKDVSGARVPLPPLPEQRRIVAKVDGLTARTARARKELNRIPTLIARYKQRLLALAFFGEIIGKRPSKGKTFDSGCWDIPDDWDWMRFVDVAEIASNLVKPETIPDLPHIAPDNIEAGTARLLPYRTIAEDKLISAKNRFYPGQVLYSKIRPYLKKAVIVDFDGACSADMYPISARSGLNPRYLLYWLISDDFAQFSARHEGRTVLPKINQKALNATPFPLPPLEDQTEVVRRIESAFGWLDRLANEHAAAAKLLPKLDGAILAKAFRGELVPQDPNDEPASALLERVAVERAERAASPRTRKTNTKKDRAMVAKPVSTRTRLLDDCKEWPASGLTYEDVAKRVARPYDDIREALFELLSDAKPQIVQAFDPDREIIVLRRAAA